MFLASIILSSFLSVFAHAEGDFFDYDYTCYQAVNTEKKSPVREIRVGLTKLTERASIVVFVDRKGEKYGTDVFCNAALVGDCGLLEDNGHFEVIAVNEAGMSADFLGDLQIVAKSSPRIQPSKKNPAKRQRFNFKAVAKDQCHY